jgi:hypothetical protein
MKKLIIIFMIIFNVYSIFAANPFKYIYDANGNRTKRYLENSECDCPCPTNKDTWLVLSSTVGNTNCSEYQCKMTNLLTIPAELNCYTHYTVFDGVNTSAKEYITSGGHLNYIDRCMEFGEEITITVKLYRSLTDNSPCVITKTYKCLCNCPENSENWFTLTASKSPDCGPTQCKVVGSLEIPEQYSCYTKYKVYDGNTTKGPFDIPSNGNISQIEQCIESDETFTATIYLLRNVFDQNPCVIEKSAYCDYDCCDFIDINFIAKTTTGPECCWKPNVTTYNSALCNLSEVTVAYFDSNNQPITLNSSGEICLSSSANKTITYTVSIDGVACETKSVTLTCNGCTCPPTSVTNGWLNLTVQKGNPNCPVDACSVMGSFDIDPEYAACFTNYSISYIISDNKKQVVSAVDLNSTLRPLTPTSSIIGLPECIMPGQTIQIEVRIYKNGSTTDYCSLFSNEVFCEKTKLTGRPEPCKPDNLNDNWTVDGKVMVTINGCTYWVSYKARKTADGKQDVQMTNVEKADPTCGPTANLEDVFKAALPVAIKDIIDKNEQFTPQNGSVPPCVDTWRVVQQSCWSKWEMFNQSAGTETEIFVPCASACCVRQLRVCNFNGIIHVQDLGFSGGTGFNCSMATLPANPGSPINTSLQQGCTDKNCDIYADFDVFYDKPDTGLDYIMKMNLNLQKVSNEEYIESNDYIIYQINQSLETIDLVIAESKLENIEIQIHNTLGQVIYYNNVSLNKGSQTINIDISNYTTGVYYINLVNDGIVFGNKKIIIVK